MGICLSLLVASPLSTLPAHVIGLMLKGRGLVEVEWEGSGVVRRLSGVVTIDDLDVSAAQIQGDERIDRLRYGIHDFRDATDIDVLDDDIEFMAMRAVVALESNVVIRIAFVGDQPVVHKLIEAFTRLGCGRVPCRRFDSMAAARCFATLNF